MGRTISSVNKVKALARERLDEMGADPLQFLAQIMLDEKEARPFRADCAKELMNYIYPKRKAMEFDLTEVPDDAFAKEAERRVNLKILKGDKVG